MREGREWLKLFLACLLAGSLALAGCSGDDGDAGTEGLSAYEIAVRNGFVGTEEEWLESLQGTGGGDTIVTPQVAETAQCVTCHTSFDAAALQEAPFGDEITERFKTSRHANQAARAGFCSACHSHEGGKELLAMPRQTSYKALQEAYTAETSDAYSLPVGSSTIVGVNKKTCSTCHTTSHYPTKPGLRGDGDILDADGDVIFSAEFNLCTACHMVDVVAIPQGHGDAGNLYSYELSDAYTSANLFSAETQTFDFSNAPFYHDGASGNGRTMVDTHFGGTIMEHLVKFNASSADIEIKGYNINAAGKNACTICHDPHTGGKMLSVVEGQSDNINNLAIGYAEGLGDFHTNHFSEAQGHGCLPCHSGDSLVPVTFGAPLPSGSGSSVVGCRTCHDLAVPNAGPGQNNSAAFAEVREFPAGYQFAFNSGAVVDAADLGVNQICFECHKGRNGVKPGWDTTTQVYGVSYLHYAPSMAILFGDESKMVPTYPGKTYAGRFTHPVANAAGSFEFGCVDCHDVHNTNGNHAASNKMTNPAYEFKPGSKCNDCHGVGALSADTLKARTVAYGQRLLDTILTTYNARFDPDITAEDFHTIMAGRNAASEIGANDLAVAASIYKIFNYEDGSPSGTEHGHGGSWAHNSVFARQVMFDAIESLGGNVTGLSRP